MNHLISIQDKALKGSISLPASKSISNRVLIINALSYNPYPIQNLSLSDDTQVLKDALYSNKSRFDIGHAGTAMRFLTAFLSKIVGEWEITGSERMKQRPVGILVDALIQLGARIEYLEAEGYPPLKIIGSHLQGKTLNLNGSISSQYISALLMIAPTLENGLILNLAGEVTSRSYIELTLKIMAQFGIKSTWEGSTITIPEQNYLPREYTIEADWSGASYWYQAMALAEKGELLLEKLQLESMQGDAQIAHWFEQFGVYSRQMPDGVLLTKSQVPLPDNLTLDFIENPDMAQTMACLCVAKKIPFHFYGLKTLKIKETDRVTALCNELAKFGAALTEPHDGELAWNGVINDSITQEKPFIKTYHDHRMALAFAPMALANYKIEIEDPGVVTKSYPSFWDGLRNTGFTIEEIK